jgi:small subunit ribosomal protein S4
MGAPKKQRRKYSTPKKPYDRTRLESEKKVKIDFGLRRKKEIWRAQETLRGFRQRARELQAKKDEAKEKVLFERIKSLGISCSNLDDILEIGLEDMLSRRLQSIVQKKGLANTPLQARQFIVHGHIYVNGRKVLWPGYIVKHGEEESVIINQKLSTKMIEAEREAYEKRGGKK